MTTIRKRTRITAKGDERVTYMADYRDGSGKRRFKSFGRKKDAERWLDNARLELRQGVHTADSQSVTVAEAADRWIDAAKKRGCRKSTLHGYDNLSRLHVVPFLGNTKLSALTRSMVIEFRDKLQDSGRSPAMVKKAVRALSLILSDAMDKSLVAQNVAHGVRIDSRSTDKLTNDEKVTIPEPSELRAMLDATPENDPPLILLTALTGLRAGELRALRWTDIDFSAAKLSVKQSADLWNNIGQPKSPAAYRTIPMPPMLVKALKVWKLACPKSELDLVLPNARGGVFGYQNLLRRVFFPIQIAAGLSSSARDKDGKPKFDKDGQPILNGKYGFHALRHAAASTWIKQKVDLKRLQVWIGHSNIQITLDTYGHLMEDDSLDASIASEMEKIIFS